MKNRTKGLVAGATGVFATAAAQLQAAAQDTAAAGNGGTATSSADGGSVSVGDINSGGNVGNAVAVGDVGSVVCDKWGHCWTTDGAVAIDGGDVTTTTSLGISADGGVAISDASGGENNFAFVS